MNALIRSQLLDTGLLFLRIGFGVTMLLSHGWPKLANYSTYLEKFPDPIGFGIMTSLCLAIFAEVACSILVVIGLATRLAAIPLLITMGVAFFVIHGAQPFSEKEMSFIYMISFLILLFTGGGKFSLDYHLPVLKRIY
ncbi:MAG: DoxX family protein [Pseudobdellovibrionaceae bacterium]